MKNILLIVLMSVITLYAQTPINKVSTQLQQKINTVNANEKINALQAQMKHAHDTRKTQIEKRIEHIKEDQRKRSEKLQKANKLANEALTL